MGFTCGCTNSCTGQNYQNHEPNEVLMFNPDDDLHLNHHSSRQSKQKGAFNLDIIAQSSSTKNPQDYNEFGESMSQFYLDFYGDDEEVQPLRRFISPQEIKLNFKFTKNFIIDFIENTISKESINNKEDKKLAQMWEEKLKTPTFKYYMKKLNSSSQHMRIDCVINSKFKIDKFIKCLNTKVQQQWDANITQIENESLINGVDNINLTYTLSKKQLQFQPRDFFDKTIQFYKNGKFYRYASSAYDLMSPVEGQTGDKYELTKQRAVPSETVRATTIYSISIIEREQDGENKIKGTFIQYLDLQIDLPKIILDPFMAKATKSWFDELNKFYIKNHKKL